MSTLEVFHWVSVVLYGLLFFYTVYLKGIVKLRLRNDSIKQTVTVLCIALNIQSGVYVGLRLDWILSNYHADVDNYIGNIWLAYECISAVILLVILRLCHRVLNFRDAPRKRWEDNYDRR